MDLILMVEIFYILLLSNKLFLFYETFGLLYSLKIFFQDIIYLTMIVTLKDNCIKKKSPKEYFFIYYPLSIFIRILLFSIPESFVPKQDLNSNLPQILIKSFSKNQLTAGLLHCGLLFIFS